MKERLIVLRHLVGSVWTADTGDGDAICDFLALGAREIGGQRGVPETWIAGEQLGTMFCPYSRQLPVYDLVGKFGRPRPVAR